MPHSPLIDRLGPLLAAPDERPSNGVKTLHVETVVPAPIETAFAFFSDAANLQRLTPPWLNFRILTPLPIAMHAGAIIDYRIGLYGLPVPWRTRIDAWEPGLMFVDRQIIGPYRWWHHQHWFAAVDGGTRVIDHVEYVPRARWLSAGLVARDVQRIFEYRQQVLGTLLSEGSAS
ncbi:MAG TPA: SRPBCC family protein [Vicinamibacterales bacterium]|nr:SRPBCC family protein [Vicinamibacterales bacterium]